MDYTEDEITETYQEGLDIEFRYMAEWFQIVPDSISDEMYQEGLDLLAAVYSHSSYTVKEPVENSEGTYMVEVELSPVDVFAQVYDGDAWMDFYDEFMETYADADPNAMSDEEYTAYEDAWARGIFDLCWEAEKNAGYLDSKTVALQVKPDDDGYYSLVDDDFDTIDYMILAYTAEE